MPMAVAMHMLHMLIISRLLRFMLSLLQTAFRLN